MSRTNEEIIQRAGAFEIHKLERKLQECTDPERSRELRRLLWDMGCELMYAQSTGGRHAR